MVKHTLYIFERLYNDIPPLVPEDIKKDMKAALEQMRHNYSLSLEEMEDTLLSFGKKLWPYRKAFNEFFEIYESELGESFLKSHLSSQMKKRYEEFVAYGVGFRDLHSGNPASFFSDKERMKLCEILVETSRNIRTHTIQAVGSTERRRYEERVVEFQVILDDIEKRLDTLRIMADSEQEHPGLSAEIREQVREFEEGLCALAHHTSYEAVCGTEEYFFGRRQEKLMRV